MNSFRSISTLLFLIFSACNLLSQDAKITDSDIDKIIGSWEGSLTYLDYSSGKPFSMPCNAFVKRHKNGNDLQMKYEYPNEPKANRSFKLKISQDGTKISKEKITDRISDPEGNTMIIVETKGRDGNDNKKATIKQTYGMSNQNFIIRKEVKFEGTTEWILRNEYNFTKVE